MTLLSTSGLSKNFSGLRAVTDVNFEIEKGEIRALIGPNGAGKTTFVSLLCGRLPPSSGSIWFDGQEITRLPSHERILLGLAYTFQITSIFAGLPVEENVALAARRRLIDPDEALRATHSSLKRVGLHDCMDQEAGDLSYGHQRLLEIAMGLAQSPRLLILDEPTQGLSDAEIDSFKALIRHLSNETTVLLIEHNMSVVMETAHRVTVLNFGEVLAEGTPEQVRADEAVQAAYLGTG